MHRRHRDARGDRRQQSGPDRQGQLSSPDAIGVGDYQRRLAQTALDYSYWDEAVENLVTAPDPDWADENVGIYLFDTFGISSSYVVDENDRTSYSMIGGERADNNPFTRFSIGIKDLVEAARGGVSEETPVPSLGLLAANDMLYIGAANVLTDYDYSGDTTINLPTGAVLVLTRALDSDLLAEISGHYRLDDLRLVMETEPPEAPALALFSAGGEAAGFLAWRTELPGREMLEWVIPALVAALVGLTALTSLFLARTERAVKHLVSQDQLIETEKKLRRQESELAHMARVTTMGEMASTLAHELNQPLTSIVNYADGSMRRLRQAAGADSEEIRGALQRISEQAVRASEMIAHIAQFVRKSDAEMGSLDVNDVVRRVTELIKGDLDRGYITMRLQLGDDLPRAAANAVQIEQVVLNLLRNGIEACQAADTEGRELVVETRRDDGQMIEVAVMDRGEGLPSGDPDQVFDPFYTTKPAGMGMGLSISRTVVEAHGGRLWAIPNIDRGTAFHFTLPGETASPGRAGQA